MSDTHKIDTVWTLPQAVAWIIWRSHALVRTRAPTGQTMIGLMMGRLDDAQDGGKQTVEGAFSEIMNAVATGNLVGDVWKNGSAVRLTPHEAARATLDFGTTKDGFTDRFSNGSWEDLRLSSVDVIEIWQPLSSDCLTVAQMRAASFLYLGQAVLWIATRGEHVSDLAQRWDSAEAELFKTLSDIEGAAVEGIPSGLSTYELIPNAWSRMNALGSNSYFLAIDSTLETHVGGEIGIDGKTWYGVRIPASLVLKHWPSIDEGSISTNDRTGLPGRPSLSANIIDGEFARRCETGQLEPTLREQAVVLVQFLEQAHPSRARPTPKTVENRIRKAYNSTKRMNP